MRKLILPILLAAALPAQADLNGDLATADKLWLAGEIEAAQGAFDQIVSKHADSAMALRRVAGFHLSNGRYGDAVGHYQTSIQLQPDSALSFIGLGLAYRHQGQMVRSRAALDQALRLEPERRAQLEPLLAPLEKQAAEAASASAHAVRLPLVH